MNNISSVGNFVNNGVKFQLFEHKPKGLIKPQISKYPKSEYDKNRISLYEYKEVKLLNPNSEKSNFLKYSGYEFPSVGLVSSNSEKSNFSKYSGYEFPSVGIVTSNSEKSNSPKYVGYELPSIGLVAPDKIKVASYGGVYEYPVSGQH